MNIDDLRERMLMQPGGAFDMQAPTAGITAAQPQPPPQQREQDPLFQIPFQPSPGVLPQASREPGLFKRMLMNFTHQIGNSLLSQSGQETFEEKQQRELENAQRDRQLQQVETYQQGMTADRQADNLRKEAEDKAKLAAEESKRIPVAAREEYIKTNNLPPGVAAIVRATGIPPSWYSKPEPTDKNTNELEALQEIYGKSKGADEYDRRLRARAAAGRSTTSVGLPDTASVEGPLKNASEEKFATMRAQGKLTDQQLKAMYPGKAGMASLQRISLRAAQLAPEGNLNSALSAPAQKDIRSAETALDNVRELKGIIEKAGLTQNDSQFDKQKWKEYIRYKVGMGNEGDYPKAFARMSLGSLREATAVLAGTSRAWAALHRALEHTPSMAYTPKGNYQRLKEIEIALNDVVREANQYGSKSGLVVQPDAAPQAGPGAPPQPPPPEATGGWGSILKKSKKVGAGRR